MAGNKILKTETEIIERIESLNNDFSKAQSIYVSEEYENIKAKEHMLFIFNEILVLSWVLGEQYNKHTNFN